jgi:hypothetical protein
MQGISIREEKRKEEKEVLDQLLFEILNFFQKFH